VTSDAQVQRPETTKVILDERFNQPALNPRLSWLNPPPTWTVDSSLPALIVQPAAPTDFWQQTHYGFRADNGHFLFTEVAGDFTITTKVRFHPVHQYDQAGLMVRLDQHCWIKTSVEHEPHGPARLGAVVTNRGFSDWSVQDFPCATRAICLRIRKEASDFFIEFTANEPANWNQMRIAHLNIENAAPLSCGLYACSPKGDGFRAEFEFFEVTRNSD
jgi:regulation of enolase protein 1 (concanavalin A-like superfamily)